MSENDHKRRARYKKLHLAAGLLFLWWFGALGLTGVLLNHPELLDGFDLPRKWVPGPYSYADFNRGSFRGTVQLSDSSTLVFGEAGVFRYRDASAPGEDFSQGLPPGAYRRDVRALAAVGEKLFAGTRGGLYTRDPGAPGSKWERVEFGEGDALVNDLFIGDGRFHLLTRSALYTAPLTDPLALTRVELGKVAEPYRRPNLFRLIFDLHSGAVWGLPGKLLVDLLGLVTLFLSLTGGWFWYRKMRGTLATGSGGLLARRGLKFHIKVGLLAAPLLLLVTLTGIFQRPPFLIAIAYATYPEYLHPGPRPENPWEDKLRKGLYDPSIKRVVVSTAEGVYETDSAAVAKGRAALVASYRSPIVSVMGATVFRKESSDPASRRYLVGSMSGLYLWDRGAKTQIDLFTGAPPADPSGPPVGAHSVVGFGSIDGRTVWADYDRGLMLMDDTPARLPMPEALADGGRISLWHLLFEIHNGRVFGFLLGWWAWIVVPLGGLLLGAELLTGLVLKIGSRKKKSPPP